MRTRSSVCRLFLAIVVLFSLVAVAQNAGISPAPKYDVAKEVTIKGTVDDVKELPVGKENHIHLMVKTGTEMIEVRLCPSGVLKDFDLTFEKGQQIEVTGSRVKIDDKDVILAREVVNGNSTVVLRDKTGAPVWTWLKKG